MSCCHGRKFLDDNKPKTSRLYFLVFPQVVINFQIFLSSGE